MKQDRSAGIAMLFSIALLILYMIIDNDIVLISSQIWLVASLAIITDYSQKEDQQEPPKQ